MSLSLMSLSVMAAYWEKVLIAIWALNNKRHQWEVLFRKLGGTYCKEDSKWNCYGNLLNVPKV